MKSKLSYQISEYDCGLASLQSMLSFLFEREEIPVEIIRIINQNTLDACDSNGVVGKGGTSREAMHKIVDLINEYSAENKFLFSATYLSKEEVNINTIRKCLSEGGCAILRTFLEVEHYVLIVGMDNEGNQIYIWDPYQLEKEYFEKETSVKPEYDKPYEYNRIVNIERFLEESRNDFAIGQINYRECILYCRQR